MENVNFLNEACFNGMIVGMRGNDQAGSITLACPTIVRSRKSGKFENSVRVNYPVLSYNKDTVTKDIASTFKVRDHVEVTGRLQSYIRMDEKSGETREMMNAYITEIQKQDSLMEHQFGQPGHVYPVESNEVYLTCRVAGVTKRTDTVALLRFDLSTPERKNMINGVYFNAPSSIINALTIGDIVNVVGMVQTVDTSTNKAVRTYQQLVILDLSKYE